MRFRRSSIAAAALAAALLAGPAEAGWLVTRDGGRVETRGAWTVKGKLVVFTRADGQLASLRATEVDWTASERATEEALERAHQAAEPKAVPVLEKKEARWVMTDADFERRTPPPAAEAKEAPAPEETDAAGRPRLPVTVDTWDRRNHPEGLEIYGTLSNPGTEIAAEVGVTVRLYDETGALLATSEGRVATPALGPGAQAGFRASFPGVFTYADAKLEVRGYGLRIKAAEEEKKP